MITSDNMANLTETKTSKPGQIVVFSIFPWMESLQIQNAYSWTIAESRNVHGFPVLGLVFSKITKNRDHNDMASTAAILDFSPPESKMLSTYLASAAIKTVQIGRITTEINRYISYHGGGAVWWSLMEYLAHKTMKTGTVFWGWIPLRNHQLDSGFGSLVSLIGPFAVTPRFRDLVLPFATPHFR